MAIPYDGTARQLAARIPSGLHHAVKLAAFKAGVTVQEWVAEALETHLREVTGPDGKVPAAPDTPPHPRKPAAPASA